ncbi:uncharacterized protein LOC135703420 [Ochlerotatus camptorhynchus]|uniref:uncharacterized protein LOC135703420 n=1 Tax=Ochlerotatus camptorhynchus TaxID=644619 RepID=UPI0031D6FD14
MESDVICLDSDEEGEHDPKPRKPGGMSANACDTIAEQLLRPLQALSLKLYFGQDGTGGNGTYQVPADEQRRRFTAVVKRVAELVQRFGRRKFSNNAQDVAQQRDAWKQVLKFLFLLRAIGPESMTNDDGGRNSTTTKTAVAASGGYPRELPPETRRYRLTVMDVLVDYIRHKCSALAGERNPAVLLAECNQIVSSLYIIFDGDSEFVTLTLLKMDLLAGSGAVALMYPVFEQILANQARRSVAPFGIMYYVRLLLCYKKWKAMVPARRDKDAINALALKILPPRCPPAESKQDLPFVQMLPRLSASAKEQEDETRFLLAKDLMEIEQLCAIYFREYEKRFFQRNEPKLSPLEVKSNFINIDALAEFIQRKCNLLLRGIHRRPNEPAKPNAGRSGHQRQQLQHESNAIISSLRLIFRRDEEFIALTLLRVETCPECQAILGPVYERFLSGSQLSPSSVFGTNNVETYGRLLLCYVKWKRLYRIEDASGQWERIDTIALATLPYDFPRAIKRRELAIKALFPRVATAVGRRNGKSAKVSVTGALLNSKHVWDNIQEMCLQFLAICCDGRSNREKAQPIHIEDAGNDKDDEVEIVKSEPSPVIVLDSDDEEEPHPIIDCTDTEMKCLTMPSSENNGPTLDTITRSSHEPAKICNSDHLLMETIFNTPPPTPKAEEDQQPLPLPTSALPSESDVSAATAIVQRRKSMLPKGVTLKISKNVRLRSNREKRQFMSAFRKLNSDECFHINLRTSETDYCLRKTVAVSSIFVEVISFAEFNPGSMIALPISGNGLELSETSFTNLPSIRLEDPILQEISGLQSTEEQQALDDQLMRLITTIDDFPQLSPESVDFTVFSDEPDRTSMDALTNDQTPPSTVVNGYCLWPHDDFSIFANLDFNPWLGQQNTAFPAFASSCTSLV